MMVILMEKETRAHYLKARIFQNAQCLSALSRVVPPATSSPTPPPSSLSRKTSPCRFGSAPLRRCRGGVGGCWRDLAGRVVHVAPPRGQAAAAAFASAFRALVARSVRRIRTSPGHGCTVLGVVLCQLFKTLSTPFPALTRRYRRRGGAAPRPIASYASIGAIRGVGDALRRLPRCVDQTRRMQGCQSGWGRREVS